MDICRQRYVHVNHLLEQGVLLLNMPVQVDDVARNFWSLILHKHVELGCPTSSASTVLEVLGCTRHYCLLLAGPHAGPVRLLAYGEHEGRSQRSVHARFGDAPAEHGGPVTAGT